MFGVVDVVDYWYDGGDGVVFGGVGGYEVGDEVVVCEVV